MIVKNKFRLVVAGSLLAAISAVGLACGGGGVSQSDLDDLQESVNALENRVQEVQQVAGQFTPEIIAELVKLGEGAGGGTTGGGDASFVHGTFDTNDVINQNIRDGVTEFGIDQQPFLQGYGAVTSLYLNWLFNARPPDARTLTGPGFVTTENIDDIPANRQGYANARENVDVDLVVFDHGGPTNEWWETMRKTVDLAARNLGVGTTDVTSEIGDNADSSLTRLQGLSANRGDGYIITLQSNSPSGQPWKDAVQRLLDLAPVVVYNAGAGPEADEIPYSTFVGQAERQAGYLAGQALAREVTRKGLSNPLAACLNQGVGNKNLDDRCRGFAQAMEEAGIDLVTGGGVLKVDNDVPTTVGILSDFYSANPGVNVFLTLGPDPARGFYQFLDDENVSDDDIVHGAFDTGAEIEANIMDGTTLFRIDQQQPLQGYGAIMALALQVRYGIVPASPLTLTGPGLIRKADIEGGTVPSRFPFGNAGTYPSLESIRTMAGQQDFIAIQHAECAYDSFWCVVQEGVEQAAEDTGVNVRISAPAQGGSGADDLARLVREAVSAQPDGILLTYTYPNNADFKAAVESAIAAGIPVVAYNAGSGPIVDEVGYLTVYNQDEEEAGRQAATRLIAAARDNGLTPVGICINHQVGNTSTDARCKGFVDVFNATSGATLANSSGVLQTTDDPTSSAQTITDFYASNGTTNVFLTMGPNSAGPFYQFVDDEGLTN